MLPQAFLGVVFSMTSDDTIQRLSTLYVGKFSMMLIGMDFTYLLAVVYNQRLVKIPLFEELSFINHHNILCYENFLLSLQKIITLNVC